MRFNSPDGRTTGTTRAWTNNMTASERFPKPTLGSALLRIRSFPCFDGLAKMRRETAIQFLGVGASLGAYHI